MFTGIVQDVGRVARVARVAGGRRLEVATSLDTATFQLGESVAVNGICLTVSGFSAGRFEADVSPETLEKSSLARIVSGGRVNLERALRPVDRLGGHFVLGHVDGTGELRGRGRAGVFEELEFSAPAEVSRYLVAKGSVAVDGVSLTVARCSGERFVVAAIPHTLDQTNLPDRQPGDRVNLEADILGKYVEKFLSQRGAGTGLTLESLARGGFLK